MNCEICGNDASKTREWRHCPLHNNRLICGSKHCFDCEFFRKEEEKGTAWCTYWNGRDQEKSTEQKKEILKWRLKILEKSIAKAYKMGWKNIALEKELEQKRLLYELRKK